MESIPKNRFWRRNRRRQDRLDIAAGRRTPQQVERDNNILGIDPTEFVTVNMREACERL
jgi:hypothetical protein